MSVADLSTSVTPAPEAAAAAPAPDAATTPSSPALSPAGSVRELRPARGWWWRFFRSEVALIAGRRRNQAGLAVLALVPVLIAVAVRLARPRPGRGPDFFSNITSNGIFVALAALGVEIAMFLPLAMAVLSGDSLAGEANQGTLRYLLTVPVSRTRLLLVKYASLCFGALWGVALVAVTGVVVGVALFGTGPMITLSGTQLPFAEALWRLLLVVLYLSICLSSLAAVGLFVSALTQQPMAVTIAVMMFTILSWVLDTVPQVAWLHPWLIVHEWTSFGDLLRDPLVLEPGTGAGRGILVAFGYAVVFVSAAWARFSAKDITS